MQWSSLIIQLYYIISYYIIWYLYVYLFVWSKNVEMWRASKPHQLQLSPGCQVAYVSGAPGTSLGALQSCCARTQRQACKAWLLMVWLDAGEFHRETWWKMAEVGRMDLNLRFAVCGLKPGCNLDVHTLLRPFAMDAWHIPSISSRVASIYITPTLKVRSKIASLSRSKATQRFFFLASQLGAEWSPNGRVTRWHIEQYEH